jgi:uncharacterized protein (DUF58 family)
MGQGSVLNLVSYALGVGMLLVVIVLATCGKVYPTFRSFVLLALPVPVLLAGLLWPWFMWISLLYTLCLMGCLLVDAMQSVLTRKVLRVVRHVESRLDIGEEVIVQLVVSNGFGYPVQGFLQDSVPHLLAPDNLLADRSIPFLLKPQETVSLSYSLFPNRRGVFLFGAVYGKLLSRFKLLWLPFQQEAFQQVLVTPNLRQIQKARILIARSAFLGEVEQSVSGTEGTRFTGLRDYLPGDNPKQIAWIATAKFDRPVVRLYQYEVEQPLLVMMDAGRHMATWYTNLQQQLCKFDWMLNNALALMTVALERKDMVGFSAFDAHPRVTVLPGKQMHQCSKIRMAMETLFPQNVESDYEAAFFSLKPHLKHASVVVLFTDLSDPQTADNLQQALKRFTSQHTVIIVSLCHPVLACHTSAEVKTITEAYQSGVIEDLKQERKALQTSLRNMKNVSVLDTTPEKMTMALYHRYISLKHIMPGRLKKSHSDRSF